MKSILQKRYKRCRFIWEMFETKIIGVVEGWRYLSHLTKFVSIVDDERDITELFKDALQRLPGLSIFSFTDPIIAIEHFKMNKNFYALVISDLRMPVINGIQLLKTVKDLNPEVRTVLMTAFDVEDKLFQEYIKKEIIDGFAQKPIRLDNLFQEVSKQLHGYELQKIPASKWLE